MPNPFILFKFQELVHKLSLTNSRIEKEQILKEYKDNEDIKYILNFIYNPFIVTGISKKKALKYKDKEINNCFSFSMTSASEIEFLEYFKTNNTGRDYDLKYLEIYSSRYTKTEKEYLYDIVTKDIKLGIQPTTLNKVFGKNFIPQFGCMLAQKYFDNPEKLLPQGIEFELTTKLDGVRCLCIYEDRQLPKFYSRQGQIFEGLDELQFEFRGLPSGHVYDGELLLKNDNNLDSKDLYRETMKVVSADGVKHNVIFNAFDMTRLEDFEEGVCNIPCKERKRVLKERISKYAFQFIKNVDVLYEGIDQSKIIYWLDKITSKGGEGVMINISDAPYECKRTKNLLKVKKFQSADVLVVDMEEGTGQNKGRLGALKIKFIGPDNKEYYCSVGSGLTEENRIDFWEHKDKVLNKIIEIGYFEITQNQQGTYGLRFPTFKWIREDKTEISMY